MADNVAITAGTGTNIATDDVGGVHFQKVKLYASTDGTEAVLSRAEDAGHTDGDHGFLVLGVRNYAGAGTDGDYSALSTDASGDLRTVAHRELIRVECSVSAVTTATTAYTAGDQVGAVINIANAARVSGGSGIIVGATMVDDSDIIGAYDIVLFSDLPSLTADNSVFGLNDVDSNKIVGIMQLSGAWDIGSQRVAQAYNLAIPYVCTGTALYAGLITRFGHTFFSAGVSLRVMFYVERN